MLSRVNLSFTRLSLFSGRRASQVECGPPLIRNGAFEMAAAKKKEKKSEEAKDEAEEAKSSAEAEPQEGAAGAGAGESKKKKFKLPFKLSAKQIVLFVALPIAAITALVGGAFALGFIGGGDKEEQHAEGAHDAVPAGHSVFYDLPELLVNISGQEAKESFLKLTVSLELKKADDTAAVETAMPRVIDSAQVFLRELRVEDLNGSAGLLRLREELLKRVNAATAPVEVRDVLFKEIIVQ